MRVRVRSLTWFMSMVVVVMVEQAVRGELDVLGPGICRLAAGGPAASAVC